MNNSEEQKEYYFQEERIFWSPVRRKLYDLIVLLLLLWGWIGVLSLIVVVRGRWQYGGILGAIFLGFVLIKRRYSDFFLEPRYFRKRRVNLARFLSPDAKQILADSVVISKKTGRDKYLTLCSLLLKDRTIRDALERLDITFEEIKDLQNRIIKLEESEKKREISEQEFCRQVARQALKEALTNKCQSIDKPSLLMALYELSEGQLEKIFSWYKINKTDLRIAFILSRLSKTPRARLISGLEEERKRIHPAEIKKVKVNRALTSRPTPLLDKYGVDFTDLARRLRIGIMIGHRDTYQAMVDLLARRDKRNILLVGPAGAGKETIVSYLAYNLVRDNVPSALRDFRLVKLPLSSLFSEFNTSLEVFNILTKIVQEFHYNRDIILYLPDFHNLKLLTQEQGGITALDILKPLINSTWIPIIGATSDKEYSRYLETDGFITSNFSLVRVEPVSTEEAIQILAYKSLDWESKEKIRVSYRAIKRATSLAVRYFSQIPLPSSAEAILTEALQGAKRQRKKIVTEQDIVNLVSVKTKIPLVAEDLQEKQKLLQLEKLIHQYLINQEEAVKLVANALRTYRAGLSTERKPIAVFLFVGPTGVGKTELAKTLARIYFGSEKTMIRFDMAEYQFRESLIQFIGSPDGKIEGALTEAVKKNPFSLILLDEFEKAHPDILNLFLSVFDEGRLTDNQGRVIDFTNTIIIATSNALSDYIKQEIEKGTPFQVLTERLKKKLTDYFRPELLNRFNEVVVFRPLSPENLKEIVKLKLSIFARSLRENKNIRIEFTDEVIEKIAQLGYNPIFGARPLNSVIRHFIKEPLAESILEDKIGRGSCAVFTIINGKIKLNKKK